MTDPNRIRDVAQAGKDRDPAWYRVHRRLSIHVTAALLRTSVKLDHVTYAMMLMGLLAAALLLSPSPWLNALGVAAGYASFLLDKVDGEIARVRRQASVRGILLDRFHHRLVEPLLFLAVGVRAWQATGSAVPVFAALATMLAANIIEETQQLPPFIAAKHARETRSWPVSRRVPSPAVERAAAVMRSLKTFRMYLTVLPLVLLAVLAEAWTGRSITTAYLLVSAVALWAYALFQAWYYTNGQLDAEIAALTRQLPPLPAPDAQPAEPRVAAAPAEASEAAAAPRRAGTASIAATGALLLALVAGPAAAATYYVDQANPAATTSGPGTESQPYSTIASAVSARAAAGNTILVKPGTYREQVTIPVSGTSAAPFVLRATGPGVVVDGADDYSSPGQWVQSSGTVYVASSVTWAPKQVIAGGVLLTATTNSVSSMPVNSFRQVSGQGLYVNLGGGNPGQTQTFVGRRASAFVLSGRSWVVIDGFTATRSDDRAISLSSGCADVQILNNTVSYAFKYGIQVGGCSRVRVAGNTVRDNGNHGLMFTVGATDCTIEDNESYRNALPGTRSANGLYMYGATNNVIRRNKWHDNQDTGQHLQSGANGNVSYNNISWNNGDHGYDHLGATGTLHLNDVSYGNHMDGFSIEGSATGTRLYNCISVQNGLTTGQFDLWVDSASLSGFQSNDNIFWNSTSAVPIRIASTSYATMAAYVSATGQDTRSIQADPRFVSPSTGDFRLQSGSPAIDNGNSSDANWPATDRDGVARFDAPGVANAGLGAVSYSDRGAHEFQSTGQPPVAQLTATPSSGAAPLLVSFSASGSADPDGSVVSYRFDFGDGTSAGPQAGPTATHTYAAGSFQASVTVTDNTGLTHTKSLTISVSGPTDAPPVVSAPATGAVAEGALLTVNVTASDPDGQAIASLTADLSALPAGHDAVFTPGAGNTTGTLTWTPSFTSSGSHTVRFFAANALADTASTVITVSNTDRAPVVTAPATVAIAPGTQGTVEVAVSDPDGQSIKSLTADLSGLPAGHNAVFTTGPAKRSGTLTWTPTASQTGTWTVTFTGSNALDGQAVTQIVVGAGNLPPTASLAATPGTGVAPLTVTLSGSASTDPEGGSLTYRFDCGDGTVIGPQAQASASHVYAAGTFTATLTVTDPAGATSTATRQIVVTAGNQPPTASLAATPSTGVAPLTVTLSGSASTDPEGGSLTYRFDCGDGTVIGPQAQASVSHVYAAGTFTATLTVTDPAGATSTATRQIVVTAGNQPPTASLAATPGTGVAPLTVTLSGSASTDPEGGSLTYRFDCGDGTVIGPQSQASASHVYAAGTFTATLTVTDPAGATSTATAVITVTTGGEAPNLVGNPSFETSLSGWGPYSGGALTRVSGGHDGGWAVQVTSTATTTSSFGINDSPNWVANSGSAGTRYRFTAWVRSTGSTGSAKLQVREYLGSTKLGSIISTPVTLSPLWQQLTVEYLTVGSLSTLDFQVYESPVALGETFLVDDVAIRMVATSGQPTVAANESESHFGEGTGLAFGARLVPTVTQANTTLHFTIPQRGPVQAELFDAAGRRVRTLVDEADLAPGAHSRQFDGRSDRGDRLGSGVYFYRVQAAGRTAVGRLVLTR